MKGTRSRERRDWTTMTPSDWMQMSPSDWMNMAPSDWMGATPSEWMNRVFPGWNRSYSDWMNIKPSDWWNMMYMPGMRPGAWSPVREKEHHRHGAGCECEDCRDEREMQSQPHTHSCRRCGSDSCECYCCIGDVDLAVYSLLGEQRVIPIVMENERHRDTQITLDLSPWTTPGGSDAPVETLRLEPATFTLPSCGEQQITLVVRTREAPTGGEKSTGEAPAGAADKSEQQKQPPDVDNCLVATADLRLVGCDHRPLRIAVAILPRNCDPYLVSCGCNCC